MKCLKNYVNAYSALCLFFCIIEQVLVAASTICMIKIGECINERSQMTFWMCMFIILLFAVFCPRYGYQRFIVKAKYRIFRSFIHDFEKNLEFKTFLIKEKEIAKEKESFFNNEIWNVVNESCEYILDFILTLLNICFNIAIIGIAIEKRFIVGYMLAFLVALLFCLFSRKRAENKSLAAQGSHVNMTTVLFYGWDTILSGNNYNHNLWTRSLDQSLKSAVAQGINKLRYLSAVSGFAMLCSSVPVFSVFFYTMLFGGNIGTNAALVVTLPRQINTIQYLNIFISSIMGWSGVYGKILGLQKAASVPERIIFKQEYIKFDRIQVSRNEENYKFGTFEEFKEWDKLKKAGRITIRGGNGSGKSTLLIGLKTSLKNNAYYFSPEMKLFFSNSLDASLSTGEAILSHISEIVKNSQVDVLILDEWDANLDSENMIKISHFLDKMAEKLCIIEVRHRKE